MPAIAKSGAAMHVAVVLAAAWEALTFVRMWQVYCMSRCVIRRRASGSFLGRSSLKFSAQTDTAVEHLENTNAKEAGPSSDRPHALTQRKR